MKEATVLFIDIVDSTSLGNSLPAAQYQNLLDEFRIACCRGAEDYVLANYREDDARKWFLRVQGDEFLGIIQGQSALEQAIDAVGLAHWIKLSWLLGKTNMDRVSEGKRPIDLAAGVHRGPVELAQREQPLTKERSGAFEGFAISVAKRVETFSRHGEHSRIMVTEPVFRLFDGRPQVASFKFTGMAEFKGVAQKFALWELIAHSDYSTAEDVGGRAPSRARVSADRVQSVADGDPSNFWLACILIAARVGAGALDDVVFRAEQLLRKDPSLLQPRVWCIGALVSMGRYREALIHITEAEDLSPFVPHAGNKVICLIKLGRPEDALKAVNAWQTRVGRGEYSVPRYYKAAILIQVGKTRMAMHKLLAGFAKKTDSDKQSLARYLVVDELDVVSSFSVAEVGPLQRLIGQWSRPEPP
jgi:class 3 adenylate cyclase